MNRVFVRFCDTHGPQGAAVEHKAVGYYVMKLSCGCVAEYGYSDMPPTELRELTG